MKFLSLQRLCCASALALVATTATAQPLSIRLDDDPVGSNPPNPSGRLYRTTVPSATVAYDPLFVHPVDVNANVTLAVLQNSPNALFGAAFQPVSDAVRAQFAIPKSQGLVLTTVNDDGPAARAGLKLHDVILTLAEKPIASLDDLTTQLKAAGDAPADLKLLRAGKTETIKVKAVTHVSLGPPDDKVINTFLIGVAVEPLDDVLRAQLRLPAGKGVVINQVVDDAPAAKLGIKVNDVLLEFAGKPIDSPESLRAAVQENRERPAKLIVLHAGERVIHTIQARAQTVPTTSWIFRLNDHSPQYTFLYTGSPVTRTIPTPQPPRQVLRPSQPDHAANELRLRVEQLEAKLKALELGTKPQPTAGTTEK